MKKFIHACVAAFIISLPIAAKANPCDDGGIGGTGIVSSRGIGGTGINIETGGIGGTGISNRPQGIGGTGITDAEAQAQSGIGGTGISDNNAQVQSGIGGTGIVGTITGFGSICVNGLEVHYFSDTPVDLDGEKISSQALAIGQVVAVKASGSEQSLVAHEIHAYNQITGPITALNVAGRKLKVMNQSVAANATQLNGLKIGQWVKVSGLRDADGNVVATRVHPTGVQKTAQTVGYLTRRGSKLYLSGTQIDGLPKTTGESDTDTRLTGVWNGNSLKIKDITKGPVSDLLHKVDVFNLQGLATDNVSKGHLNIAGQHMVVTEQTKVLGYNAEDKSLAGKAVVVRGQMKEGKAIAQSIELQQIKTELKKQHDPLNVPTRAKPSKESGDRELSIENNRVESMDSETIEHVETLDKTEKFERVESHKKSDEPEKVDRPDKIDKPDKVDRPDKIDKPDKVDRPDKIDRPDKVDRPDIDRPDRVDRPD